MVLPRDGNGEEWDDPSLEALNEQIARAVAAANQRPDPEMGGLSPDQVYRLLHTQWGAADSAIQVNDAVGLDRLNESEYFRDMRALLLAVQERGGVKATAKKNLPRSLIGELLEVTGSEEAREETLAMNKVVNELDYWPVHLARVVCEVAGLLRIRSGTFSVPRKHQGLLKEERAGELYRALFLAFFRRFNLAYLMHYGPVFPGIQATVGYTIYRVGVTARKWRAVTELYPEVFLPAVRNEIETGIVDDPFLKVEEVIVRNVIEPLIMWGLLEGRYVREKYWKRLDAVRIAPLYDAFLRFQV